jgi:cbb3-type cytochrome oxidase maturation protein
VTVIVWLIAAGALVAGGFMAAFVWAVRSGQFDDTTSPAIAVLHDDPVVPPRDTDREGSLHA